MLKTTTFLILFLFCIDLSKQKLPIKQMELIEGCPFRQLINNDDKRFDLSGIVECKGKIYVIADKEWNHHLYEIDTSENGFTIKSVIEFCNTKAIDYEGVDYCEDKFYIIEETSSDLFVAKFNSCELNKITIPWEKYQIDVSAWGNKGLEGIACDCKKSIIYLGKEREPRKIYQLDVGKGIISEPFADLINADKQGFDIADMKYEKGALYILERGRGLVTKINLKTKEKFSLSFQHIVLKNNQRLYDNGNSAYGMAEALLLTKNQIWIGIDNNGDEVSEYGKSMGLKPGNKPVIMIFKRPKGF